MRRPARKHSIEFKRKVIEEIDSGILTATQASREYDLAVSVIHNWRRKWERGELNNTPTPTGAMASKIAMLEQKVGQQALEIDLLKKAKALYEQRIKDGSYKAPKTGPYNGGATS